MKYYDEAILTMAFTACSSSKSEDAKRRSWQLLDKLNGNFRNNNRLMTSLIDMLMKFGNVVQAENFFIQIKNPNIITYTAMMHGYKINGFPYKCLELFQTLSKQRMKIDEGVCIPVIGACSQIGLASTCHRILGHIPANLLQTVPIRNCLIDMWVSFDHITNNLALLSVFTII